MRLCSLEHEHNHTTKTTCYHQGKCRCDECRAQQKVRSSKRRRDIAYGRLQRRVDATGTVRRIQALNALGWGDRVIGEHCGYTAQDVYAVKDNVQVTPWMRDKIAAVYETLSMRVPENSRAVAQVRASARRNGYVPPLAWDSIDDDPSPADIIPSGEYIDEVRVWNAVNGTPRTHKLSSLERREAIRLLHARKWSDAKIAHQIGCAQMTVLRVRDLLGLVAWPYSEMEKAA